MLFFTWTTPPEQDPAERERARTEEGLIAGIGRGDKEALTELYIRTKASVYGFALSILRNRYDAEDVLQEVYVKIYAAAAGYQPRGKPLAWILTITRNLCLMKLRSERAHAWTDADWDVPDPRDRVENSVNRMVLAAAMKALSGEERQIVMLHAIAGQKHRDIAALLGLPLSTTLSKYHRALSKLKKQVAGEESHEE